MFRFDNLLGIEHEHYEIFKGLASRFCLYEKDDVVLECGPTNPESCVLAQRKKFLFLNKESYLIKDGATEITHCTVQAIT